MYREMKDSEIEWIGEIPKNWNVLPHKHLLYKKKDLCSQYSGENILSLTMKGVIIRDLENPFGKMPATFDGYQIVKKDNLLLCLFDIDVTPRCVGLIENDGLTSPAYSQFVLKGSNVSKYYYYLLRMIDDKKCFLHLSKNLRSSLTEIDFGFIKTIAPSQQEQQKIAEYLDKKVSEIDNIINQTTMSIEEYKEYKQSLITETVTKGLNQNVEMKDSVVEHIGLIPIDWKVKKLKYLLAERNDKSQTGTEEPLSMSQKYGLIKTKDMDMIPNMAASLIGNKYVQINDLVFNKLKAHLGVFGVSSYEGLVSPDYAVYFSTGNVNVKFLEFLFKTRIYINEFKKYSRGVGEGLTRLYTDELFNIKCAIPSLEQQTLIVKYINNRCSQIDNLITQKQQLLTELESYKKSLIYECVTGKREVG